MTGISFKIITSIPKAKQAWDLLSPRETIHDEWDFRYSYYKFFRYSLQFYAAYDEDELVALLPLMQNPIDNQLEFFACFNYIKNNTVFTKPGYEFLRQTLISKISSPALLQNIKSDLAFISNVELQKYNYLADISNMNSYEDFLSSSLSSDTRKNIRSQIRKLHEKYDISISYDDYKDLDILIAYNKLRFGENSKFISKPNFDKFIKELPKRLETHTINIKINGERKAVGFVIFHKETCIGINSGYDTSISNLGKYLTLLKIDFAIKNGKKIYDAMANSYSWKEEFHLNKFPLFELYINMPSQISSPVSEVFA